MELVLLNRKYYRFFLHFLFILGYQTNDVCQIRNAMETKIDGFATFERSNLIRYLLRMNFQYLQNKSIITFYSESIYK